MYYTRMKLGKINPKNILRNAKQEYYNMENKIIDFQFGPVCANQIPPDCSVGSEQDETEIQYDQWGTPEWCNREKYEKISTS